MKSRIPTVAAVGTLILVTAALSDPLTEKPVKPVQVDQETRLEVYRQVLVHVVPMRIQFSRAAPGQEYRYETEFEPRTLVKNEARVPFRIFGTSERSEIPTLSGYYRPSDKLVFLRNEKTKEYLVAANHPLIKGKQKPEFRFKLVESVPAMPEDLGPAKSEPPL